MPAELLEDRLGVVCTFTNGTRITFLVRESPNPVLAREMLTGLVELVLPSGALDSGRLPAIWRVSGTPAARRD